MSSISNIRSNPSLDLLSRRTADALKPMPKDKGSLSATTPQGLSLASGNTGGAESSRSSTERAKFAAEGLVSATFIEPILKQVRESNDAPPPFGPSQAQKHFSAMLDTKLADEMVRGANFPLVQRITEQLLRNMPQPEQQSFDTNG